MQKGKGKETLAQAPVSARVEAQHDRLAGAAGDSARGNSGLVVSSRRRCLATLWSRTGKASEKADATTVGAASAAATPDPRGLAVASVDGAYSRSTAVGILAMRELRGGGVTPLGAAAGGGRLECCRPLGGHGLRGCYLPRRGRA